MRMEIVMSKSIIGKSIIAGNYFWEYNQIY